MSALTKKLIGAAVVAVTLVGLRANADQGVGGTYCLRGVHEVGSCIRLSADQRFEYFLAYGAYDEQSQGVWRAENDAVVLDSPAYNAEPSFKFKGFVRSDGDAYGVIVVDKDNRRVSGIDVRVKCDGREVDAGVSGAVGHRIDCQHPPKAVMLGIRMYGVALREIYVAPPRGADTAYAFEFDPGDLGRKRFAETRLRRDGPDALVMTYENSAIEELNGRSLRYERDGR